MVLEIKPTAEDIETAVLTPSRRIGEPTRQLFDENSLAQFAQDVRNGAGDIEVDVKPPEPRGVPPNSPQNGH